MIVLGIESTCDETGAAIVENGKRILSNVVASSADIHERYGGVFPELACRRHIDAILPVVDEAIQQANLTPADIDLIAVAKGPGLIGALLIGMNAAKGLSIAWKKPLIGVNHVEAHLYAPMLERAAQRNLGSSEPNQASYLRNSEKELFAPFRSGESPSFQEGVLQTAEPYPFPALGIVLSGGHTLLLKILSIGCYEAIGTTVDDAIGEAFDKVAALLSLPYPGGPHVERIARQGNPRAYPFHPGKVKRSPLDFSFSGLKTSVLYAIKGQNALGTISLTETQKADVAASFQETALRDISEKAALAIQNFPCKAIFLGGGVCNNQRLRSLFAEKFSSLPLFWPPFNLSLDNAAMIAGLGYQKFLASQCIGDPLDLEVQTRIPIA